MVLLGFCALLTYPVFSAETPESITLGSKGFTESVILGEMLLHQPFQGGNPLILLVTSFISSAQHSNL